MEGFEFGGWHHADLAVEASMVELVDVLGGRDLDVGDGLRIEIVTWIERTYH